MNTQNENRPCGENCPRKQNTITVPLSPMEKDLLSRLAVTPFLPVASDGNFPVCRELELPSPQAGNLLQKLKQRGLVRIDLDVPLEGFSYEGYDDYPLHGSMALTARGQEALDDMEILG